MSTLTDISARLAAEKLPLPPIPSHLSDQVHEVGEWTFGTRAPDAPLVGLAKSLETALQHFDEEFLFFGHAGYGTNSWAFCYYLAMPGLALFLQEPWGGAFEDRDDTTSNLRRRFEQVDRLLQTVPEMDPSRGRLVIVCSPYLESRWAWQQRGAEVAWTPSPNPIGAALRAARP
jgi:hypothetical protein